jgi:hypothetical protein
MRKQALILSLLIVAVSMIAGENQPIISGDFWKPDKVIWGDGRPLAGTPSPKHIPHGFKSDWNIEIPQTGWYELYLVGGGNGLAHDVFLDGKELYVNGNTDKKEKARNLWLPKGKHSLRIQRVGRNSFPMRAFKQFELRPATGSGNTINATKTLVDVMRAGEDFIIEVTAGGTGKAVEYELLSTNLQEQKATPVQVGKVTFEASDKPETKTVKIKCPKEGAFSLSARIAGDRDLTKTEFPIGPYAVVDVKAAPETQSKSELVCEIDCVKQTINGKAIAKENFIECNGPSRITKTVAGTYRESHDCTPPQAPKPGAGGAGQAQSYSGFSYKFEIPQIQVPYLLEIEYPDDDQRCIVMGPQYLNPKTGELSRFSGGYNCKSVQTGGMFPLSNKMHMHRAIFWPKTTKVVLTIFSQEIGTRAAAARIKLYRFPSGNLPLPAINKNGRNFTHWYEEGGNWTHLVGINKIYNNQMVTDLVGLNRWAQFIRYYGGSGMSAMGVSYQGAFWRRGKNTIEGFAHSDYDAPRLAALICEKYGIKYLPEIFPNQWYMNKITLPGLVKNPDDIRSINCNGARAGKGSAACDLNPLHPVVQNTWIEALGEMSDKLRDCKSFSGVSIRANVWLFRGDFTFPGICWGYSDWTIKQFEKDTGVKVPGKSDDPQRFMTRYLFLTSPENKDRWVNWRCTRLLEYHKKLRDRIRGNRDDLKLVFWGNFRSDPIYKVPEDTLTRMKQCGVDLAKVQKAGGIAIMPAARYGGRFVTSKVQGIYDGFFNTSYARAGMGAPRAFAAYMQYLELAHEWPAEKLGLKLPKNQTKPPYHCSASLGAGRNSLEKFAVVVAEQDSSLLQDGGNADCFGDPEIWRPWFNEYSALPPLPFSSLEDAVDPVAVWYAKVSGNKNAKDGFYFYAVNRARWPISIQLSLAGCDNVTRITNDKTIALKNGKLTLSLKPFELISFRADPNAKITGSETTIPKAMHDYIHRRIAFAQNLRDSIPEGAIAKGELEDYDQALKVAWDALERKAYWRARSVLRSAPMMRLYELTGSMPEGQIVGKFPNLMRASNNMGHWNLLEPMISGDELMAMGTGKAEVKSSNDFNPEWGGYHVLNAAKGKLQINVDIPAKGNYTLQFGLVSKLVGPVIVKAEGKTLSKPAIIHQAGKPDTAVFDNVALNTGRQCIEFSRPGGESFGLYGLKILPQMLPLGSHKWSVVGPFKSFWAQPGCKYGRTSEGIKVGMETVYPPEKDLDIKAVYKTKDGRELHWMQAVGDVAGRFSDRGVDMAVRTASPSKDFNFALAYIYSDRDQEAILMVPCDWWARAYLNGERLRTNVPEKEVESSGADFTTHYPRFFAVMKLKKGENKLLIKQQGGSLGSGFGAYISNLPGLKISPVPVKQ